jgi:2-polyprenyl-3-methyl-5-hydroxy-6-metoxy-1,4-benzoquinol methylase
MNDPCDRTVADATTPEANYDPEFYSALFAAEDRHFWFRSRNRCIVAALRSLPDFAETREVLEVGCGTGVVLAELHRLFPDGRVIGMDLFPEGLVYARRRFAGTLIQGNVFDHVFEQSFDLLAAFDVIEHLDDDEKILRRFREQLRPGGHLIVTVPAHMCLWSYFDEAAHHRRRYSARELRSKLTAAGFTVIHLTLFMSLLFPLMWLKRVLLRGRRATRSTLHSASTSDLAVHPVINGLMDFGLRPEAALIARRIPIPLGTSLLALATRPA